MSVKVTVRLSPAIIERLDALIEAVSARTGMAATRSDVVREAMMAGLRTLESPPRPRRPAKGLMSGQIDEEEADRER